MFGNKKPDQENQKFQARQVALTLMLDMLDRMEPSDDDASVHVDRLGWKDSESRRQRSLEIFDEERRRLRERVEQRLEKYQPATEHRD